MPGELLIRVRPTKMVARTGIVDGLGVLPRLQRVTRQYTRLLPDPENKLLVGQLHHPGNVRYFACVFASELSLNGAKVPSEAHFLVVSVSVEVGK